MGAKPVLSPVPQIAQLLTRPAPRGSVVPEPNLMSHFVTATQTASRQVVRNTRDRSGESVCLLLAADAGRRDRLSRSARDAGWRVVECGTAREASRQHNRWLTQLTAVDLVASNDEARRSVHEFAEAARSDDRLLIVSDEPGSPEVELWARQSGAWAYVPSPDFGEGLTELFASALAIAGKSSPAGVSH